MRKKSKRKVRIPTPPMLVNRGIVNDTIELRERMIVQAVLQGFATQETYDDLADMRNVMLIAAQQQCDPSALVMCRAMRDVLESMRDRHARTGRMGVTGEEGLLLQEFVSAYRDFWMGQSVGRYIRSCHLLDEAYEFSARGEGRPQETRSLDEALRPGHPL